MSSASKYLNAEQRRDVTVSAVIELAARQNPGDITTAAIARHMHVTQGALFRHFPNKEAIWEAAIKWVADRLLARIDRAARHAESPLAALAAIFSAHIDFVCEHPGVPRMLFGELQRPRDSAPKLLARALLQQYRQRLASLIETGKKSGEIDPSVDTAAACQLFIGTIQGLVMQSLLANDMAGVRDQADAVFAIYRRGIAGP